MSFTTYLSHLNEKGNRGDVWVMLIVFLFLQCRLEAYFGFDTCTDPDFLTMGIVAAMFTDLGISTVFTNKFIK